MCTIWVKLQANFWQDEKIMDAGKEIAFTYLASLGQAKVNMTHGYITRGELRTIEPQNPIAHADRLVELGLWTKDGDRWFITSWYKHNKSQEEITEQKSRAGRISGRVRREQSQTNTPEQGVHCVQHKRTDVNTSEQTRTDVNTPGAGSGTAVVSSSTAVSSSTVLNKSTSEPVADPGYSSPDDDSDTWEPDDPFYVFDPNYSGQDEIDYWSKNISKIQGGHIIPCQLALQTLHNKCKRSKAEIHSMIKYIAENADAKKWWGFGRTMAKWHFKKDGSTPLWQTIRANWLANGGSYGKKIVVVDPGPKPEIDYNCGCKRGWIEDDKGQVLTCPKCEKGKWFQAGGRD